MSKDNIYDEVVTKYYENIRMYCLARLHDNETAKDCTQEVFLLLYKKWNDIKSYENISAWLHITADNIMKNAKRKNIREVPTENEQLDVPVTENFHEGNDILDLLGTYDYNLLLYHYQCGIPVNELAKKLGVSESKVRKRLERAKIKLNKGKNNK